MIYKLFFIFGLSIAVIFGIAAYDDNNREWKKYQTEFLKMELQRASTPEEKASITLANEIKQIEVIELKRLTDAQHATWALIIRNLQTQIRFTKPISILNSILLKDSAALYATEDREGQQLSRLRTET